MGRWHCPDALAESAFGISPYAYANNNPINNIDLLGLKVWDKMEPKMDPEELKCRASGLEYLYGSSGSWGGMGMNAGYGRFSSGGAGPSFDYYYDGSGYSSWTTRNSVGWEEVEGTLMADRAILAPTSSNMRANGISGYSTSVDGQIIKVYIDGFGEVDVNQKLHYINQIEGVAQMKSMWCAFAIGQMIYAKLNVGAMSQENVAQAYYKAMNMDPNSNEGADVLVYLKTLFCSSSNRLVSSSSWDALVSVVKQDIPVIAGIKGQPGQPGHAIYIYGVSNADGYNRVFYWDPWPGRGYKDMSFMKYQNQIFFTYAVKDPF